MIEVTKGFSIFCYICKSHIEVYGKDANEARKNFNSSGHDNTKTNRMRRGKVGQLEGCLSGRKEPPAKRLMT